MLFARGSEGALRGVILTFATHPNAIEGDCVYSADIPGEARRVLKRLLGPEVGVRYLTGAAGNNAPRWIGDPSARASAGDADQRVDGRLCGLCAHPAGLHARR